MENIKAIIIFPLIIRSFLWQLHTYIYDNSFDFLKIETLKYLKNNTSK